MRRVPLYSFERAGLRNDGDVQTKVESSCEGRLVQRRWERTNSEEWRNELGMQSVEPQLHRKEKDAAISGWRGIQNQGVTSPM